jgi:hypothetical protein
LTVTVSATLTCLASLFALISLLFRDGGYLITYEIPEEAVMGVEVSKLGAMAMFGLVFIISALTVYLAFTRTTWFLRLQMMVQQ